MSMKISDTNENENECKDDVRKEEHSIIKNTDQIEEWPAPMVCVFLIF